MLVFEMYFRNILGGNTINVQCHWVGAWSKRHNPPKFKSFDQILIETVQFSPFICIRL